MNRLEIRQYLKQASASGIRPGLDRIRELLQRLGNPQDKVDVIHVAGTNGKGSTSAYIASILLRVYGKIGWYSSPAVIDERETVRIIVSGGREEKGLTTEDLLRGSFLSDTVYEQAMTEVIRTADRMAEEGLEKPTKFELETAGAFLAFEKEQVDLAIVEVGMGGREDATNVLSRTLVSVITPIGLDHMQFLGASIYRIAGEKAGIIREQVPVVSWQPGIRLEEGEGTRAEKRQARLRERILGRLKSEADDRNTEIVFVDQDQLRIDKQGLEGTGFTYRGEPYFTKMIGSFQPGNAALAMEAVRQIMPDISGDLLREGIAKAVLPARFDVLCEEPLTIYDGAHNPDGAVALAESVKSCLPGRKIYGVVGVFKDKAVEEIARIVSPYLTAVTTVKAPGARGLEAEPLKEIFLHINPWLSVDAAEGSDIREIFRGVQEKAKQDGAAVLVFGSLSLAKEIYRRESLLSYLQDKQIPVEAPCGGMGTCGKCKVRVTAGLVPVSEADRKIFSEEELEEGYRLACRAGLSGATGPIEVEIPYDHQIRTVDVMINTEEPADTSGSESEKPSSESKEALTRPYGLAVDVGTTTLAVSLVKLPEGRIIETRTERNPQIRFGADVISRIGAAGNGKEKELRECVCEALLELIETNLVFHGIGYADIERIVIAGNTTMLHLLRGYSVEGLKAYPFEPESLSLEESTVGEVFGVVPDWELEPITAAVPVVILPGVSAFVGADIVSGLLALDFYKKDKICALIDLGTNGEMVVGDRNRRMVTSTAAGPALEGGNIRCGSAGVKGAISHVRLDRDENGGWLTEIQQIGANMPKPVGICGSGVIDTVAELRQADLIDETGLFTEEYFENGFPLAGPENGGVVFTQDDIRQVQMAKAAVRAGFEILLERYGIGTEDVETLYLAGGFGTFLNIESAVKLGLIPEELKERTEAVGNTSLAGAVRYLTDPEPDVIRELAENSESVELAGEEDFNERYVGKMGI